MKTIKLTEVSVTLYTVVGLFLSGCGSRPAHENLPNRDVPVDMGADESIQKAVETPLPTTTGSIATPVPQTQPVPVGESRILSETALGLGELADELYVPIQKKWLKSEEKACNFFLITALCEAGYCKQSKPFYRAGDFDIYFFEKGWVLITLEELKTILREKKPVDVVAQRDPPAGWTMGHVAIPVRLTNWDTVELAQGNSKQEWNEIVEWGDREFETGGYRIFARY